MMRTILIIFSISIAAITTGYAQIMSNWRGENRQGIYNETGLLKQWPLGGPEMVWAFERLGKGFSSPVLANDKIYLTGKEDGTGYVYILTLDGRLENRFAYGPEFHGEGYSGSRNSPAVVGNMIYVMSSNGLLVCMDHTSGNIIWRLDLFNDLDGRNIRWGITETLLIDGDRIFCAPGGRKYNIVALNRHNGEIIWASEGTREVSAYCSPLLVDHDGKELLITHMKDNIVALDASNGRLMWSHPHRNRWDVHPNTPIYHKGSIYAFSGYGQGGVKLRINSVGDGVTAEWTNDMDNQMGGAVLVNGRLYGSGQNNRHWVSVDWETGETLYRTSDIAKGTVIWADDRLYCYSDRGELALLEPSSGEFIPRGMTNITLGSDQHWAHLVIANGILFVRRGNALMAFNIER